MSRSNQPPIIIKRVEDIGGDGHHGGAWKVAYADFMTALMALFLLLWVLSTTNQQQLQGIADYFTPSTALMNGPGGEGVLAGLAVAEDGTLEAATQSGNLGESETETVEVEVAANPWAALASTAPREIADARATEVPAREGLDAASSTMGTMSGSEMLRADDERRFAEVEQSVREAIETSPALADLAENVRFEHSDEGLLIQIVDLEGKPMFDSGSAVLQGRTREVLLQLGAAITGLDNEIIISGHTDAVPFANSGRYDNWELSSDRANATRRIFLGAGVDSQRITRISGLADTDPLVPENPEAASNRRITVLLNYRETGEPQRDYGALDGQAAPASNL